MKHEAWSARPLRDRILPDRGGFVPGTPAAAVLCFYAALQATASGQDPRPPRAPAPPDAAPHDLDRARGVLVEFDAAWARSDVDALMAPISPKFGCDLYGGVGVVELREALTNMVRELKGSSCTTEVLRLTRSDDSVQGYVRRSFREDSGASRAVEVQCHVYYLRALAERYEIVAMEDFDPDTLECFADGTFRDGVTGLSFAVPAGLLECACPPLCSVRQVVLRSPDLKGSIRIVLKLTQQPFDLEKVLDLDLRAWMKAHGDTDIDVRRMCKVAGRPALRAEGRWRGPTCALQPKDGATENRRIVRVYVQPDPQVLLAFDLDADARIASKLIAQLDDLLPAVRLEPPGTEYGEVLRRRLGFGVVAGGRFHHPDSGFTLTAPEGFSLERVPGSPCFSLVARQVRSGSKGVDPAEIRITAMELIDPERDAREFAEQDDASFLEAVSAGSGEAPRVSHEVARIAGADAERVERRRSDGSSRSQNVDHFVYLKKDGFLFVFEVRASRDSSVAARGSLDLLLQGIEFAAAAK